MTERELQEHFDKVLRFQESNMINANHVAGAAVHRGNAPGSKRGVSKHLQEYAKQVKRKKEQSHGRLTKAGPKLSVVKANVLKFAKYVYNRENSKSVDEQESSLIDVSVLAKQEKKKVVRPEGPQS